jgi:hypothetical protein
MQDTTRRDVVRARMGFRTRIGSALVAVPLVLALAAPALAAASPRLVLSPSRGASGTVVTMTLTNCSDPRLWTEPTVGGSGAADAGSAGYVYWTSQGKGPYSYGYEFAGTWVGSGTTWTASFTANLASGKANVFVWCPSYQLVTAIFTVR